MPFAAAAQYISSDKLCALKGIFDIVCQEAGIPVNAKAERNELARVIIQTSYSTDSDLLILDVARRAISPRLKLSA
jgi:hypothetical protein